LEASKEPDGDRKLEKAGDTIKDGTRIRELMASKIAPCLQRLADNALLIGYRCAGRHLKEPVLGFFRD
jgi:hypothetical protein